MMGDLYIDDTPKCGVYFDTVVLVLLDKITSVSTQASVPVGSVFKIDGLPAYVEVCSYFCSQSYHGYGAMLNLSKLDGSTFSNWVFGKYPGIRIPSEIRYDVDLLKCE